MRRDGQERPGLAEWLLSLAAMGLVAHQMLVLLTPHASQTAIRYYLRTPGTAAWHGLAALVDALVPVMVLWWLLRGRQAARVGLGLLLVSLAAILIGWIELVRLSQPSPRSIYVLTDLPFRPVVNAGVLGAQAYLTYLIAKTPNAFPVAWASWLVKGLLAAAAFFAQMAIWDMLSR